MPELAIVINARNQAGPALETLNKQLDAVEGRVSSMRDTLGNAGRSMQQVGGMATLGLSLPLAGIGMAAINAASDLSESTNKINVIFEEGSESLQKWAEGSALALGQSKLQALDAAATFGIFGKSAGLSGDALTEFSQGFVGLASDLASFNNTSPEDAIQAIGAALRGETEPMRRYGVLLDDMTMRQKALELGLIQSTKEALTPQNKVLAASALMWEKTSVAQGDFARTADGLANSQRIVKAQLTEITVLIGERLLPYAQKLVAWALDATKAFTSLSPQMQDFLVIGGVIAAALGPALVVLGTLVSTLGALLSPIGAVILAVGALATAFATDFMGIRSAVMPLVTVLTDRFGAISGQLGGGLSSVQDIFGEFTSVLSGTGGEFGKSTEHLEGFLEALTGSSVVAEGFVGILSSVGKVFGEFGSRVDRVVSAIRNFGSSAPWQSMVAAAGSAISTISGKLSQLFSGEISLQDLAGSVGEQIGNVVSAMGQALSSADFTAMRANLLAAFSLEGVNFAELGQNLLGFVSGAVNSIVTFDYGSAFSGLADSISSIVGSIDWSGIGAELGRLRDLVVTTVTTFDWGKALEDAGSFAGNLFNSISAAIKSVDWGALRSNFDNMASGIQEAIEGIDWSVIEQAMEELQGRLDSLTIKIQIDSGEGKSKLETMTTQIGSAASATDMLAAAWNGVSGIFGPAIGRLIGSLGEFLVEMGALIQKFQLLQVIAGIAGGVLLGVINLASSVFSNLGDIMGTVLLEMTLLFTSLRDMFGGFVDLVSNALGGRWKQAWEGAKQVVTSIAGFIGGTLGYLAAFIAQIGVLIGDLIATTMRDLGFTEIAAQVEGVVDKIREFAQLMQDFAAGKVNFQISLPDWIQNYKWPELPTFAWPEMPKWSWPELPEFAWPSFPEFKWPTWTWPSFPTWHWPSFPSFEWPEAPWWWPWGGGTPAGRSASIPAGIPGFAPSRPNLVVAPVPAGGSSTSPRSASTRIPQISIGQMIVRDEKDIYEIAYKIADILGRSV